MKLVSLSVSKGYFWPFLSELFETDGALGMLVVDGETEFSLRFGLESGHNHGQRIATRVADGTIVSDRCSEPVTAVISEDRFGESSILNFLALEAVHFEANSKFVIKISLTAGLHRELDMHVDGNRVPFCIDLELQLRIKSN